MFRLTQNRSYLASVLGSAILVALAIESYAAPNTGEPFEQSGKRVADLSLSLTASDMKYKHDGISPGNMSLAIYNHLDEKRIFEAMPSWNDDFGWCAAITFVYRFEKGELYEDEWEGTIYARARNREEIVPLTLGPKAKKRANASILGASSAKELSDLLAKESKFCVTAVIEALKLQSNTLYFNDMKKPEKEPDALEDLKTYRKQQEKLKDEEDARYQAERWKRKWQLEGVSPPEKK